MDKDRLVLVTGPARSGKSEWAEQLAIQSGKPVIYVATSQLDSTDHEWQQRIEGHRQRRPADWTVLEVPVELAAVIHTTSATHCLLIDSLGTWLANLLEQDEATWELTLTTFVESLNTSTCSVILVAEEAGWGLVPAYPLGRTFRDRLGTLVRRIAAIADAVYLVTGGHALNLTRLGTPLP